MCRRIGGGMEINMSENSFEYIIKQKSEGNSLAKKALAIIGYLAFAVILCTLSIMLPPPYVRFPLVLISVALTALLIFITWRFLCVEFEVIIESGDIIITQIYGKSIRKQLLNLPINAFFEIGEYDDKAYEEVSKLSLQKTYICISSLSAPVVYYAVFEEDKDRCILYFDAPERSIALLKKYNSGAFRASARRLNSN